MSPGDRLSGALVDLPRRALRAPLTAAACLLSLVATLGLWFGSDEHEPFWSELERWGALSSESIWDGALWGLVTTCFLHGDGLHLAYNLWWLWYFGQVLEAELSRGAYWALFLASASVSSAAELALTGTAGIGMSGVIYAFFGFLLRARRRVPRFAAVLEPRTIQLLLAWLVLCIVLTRTGAWTVANGAHVGGLVFGAGVGQAIFGVEHRLLARLATATGGVLVIGGTLWSPWNEQWTFHRALGQHAQGELDSAERWYRQSLARGHDPAAVWHCLTWLGVGAGKPALYEESLARLRQLDAEQAESLASAAAEREELRRSLEAEEDPVDKELTAASLACWDWDLGRAERGYRQVFAAHPDDVRVLGEYASFLVFAKEAPSRADQRQALALAQRAAELTGQRDPGLLDTLAHAQFQNGDPRQAYDTQMKALALLVERGESIPPGYQERADLYREALRSR